MPRYNGGFIGTDGLDAPDPPTDVTPTGGDSQLSVAFTAPTDTGTSAITGFVAQVSTNGTDYSAGSNTGTSSPIVVSSLSNGTSYTAKVWAINAYGTSAPSEASSGVAPVAPAYGFFIAGDRGSISNTIDRININSEGNATDYDDLNATTYQFSGCGSATRAITFGGSVSGNKSNAIRYFDIPTAGTAASFGNLSAAKTDTSALSNSTRGVCGGGSIQGDVTNVMEYITIASFGNASDFGDLSGNKYRVGGAASPTRGLFAGGDNATGSPERDEIEYITIGSTGNVTDFGNLSVARIKPCAASNQTRAIFAGGDIAGAARTNVIDYVTVASTGNAADFGDMTAAGTGAQAMSGNAS